MSMDHEYSILDHDRAKIFLYIGTAITGLAAAYSAGIGFAAQILTKFAPHVWGWIPRVLDVGLAFSIVYFIFNKWFWKTAMCRKIFNYRDVSGIWRVEGTTLGPVEALDNGQPRRWNATLVISQEWTKLSVCQRRPDNSVSESRSAALKCKGDRTLLMYSYDNNPTIEARQADGLQTHVGYCEIFFEADCLTGRGTYFNNLGRFTHGSMKLTKQ